MNAKYYIKDLEAMTLKMENEIDNYLIEGKEGRFNENEIHKMQEDLDMLNEAILYNDIEVMRMIYGCYYLMFK